MTGIQYVTDEHGQRTAVLIDLKEHGALWEDIMDGMMAKSRADEEAIPYDRYRAKRKNGV